MGPGRDPWVERREEVQGIPGFPPAFGPLHLRKYPNSKASSRPRAWPTQPGSRGANPDVRPEFRQSVTTAYVCCHSFPAPANPLRPSGGRLRPNAAALPLAPTKTGHLYLIATCPERS